MVAGRIIRIAAMLLLALTLHAAPTRYKVGSTIDATPTCYGPAYDIGGGGGDVNSAIQWMIDQVRGATSSSGPKVDVVVLRCSGSDGYNAPILAMNGVNSVESIVGTSSADFNDPSVAQAVSQAEVVFFAGGNQANYIQFIKGTATDTALLAMLARGGGLGGTSAGAAIQGAIIHDATTGSSTSADALGDPYHSKIHFTYGWFGSLNMGNTLCEPHLQSGGNGYDRMGRLLAFVARQVQDGKSSAMLGIGIDSETSLVVDKQGLATVMGSKNVYFVLLDRTPEVCKAGAPLTCSGYKIWMVTPGQTFNLANRPTCGYYLGSVTGGTVNGNYYVPGSLISCNPPTIDLLAPSNGPAGTQVTFTGTNLTGVTAVSFNGKSATAFSSISATNLRTTVPSGASTGPVTVTTAAGTATGGTFTVVSSTKSKDLNGIGTVDVLDLLVLAKAHLTFNPVADLNSDGVIDDQDIALWLVGF